MPWSQAPKTPYSDPEYYQRYTAREQFQRVVINAMAKAGATALAFPTTQVPSPSRAELDAGKWPLLDFPTNTLNRGPDLDAGRERAGGFYPERPARGSGDRRPAVS